MQELEKILAEIKKEKLKHWDSSERLETDKIIGWCFDRCMEIVEKYMNDGWIPVDDRLPEAGAHVIVSFKCTGFQPVIAHLSEECRWMMLQGAKGFNDITDRVSAWRPLPEPYKPGKTENNQQPDWREQFMRKFERVE